MLYSEICKDLSARLCGAPIGVCGDGELLAALCACGAENLVFKEGAEGCGALIIAGNMAEFAENSAVPFIIVAQSGEYGERYGCACVQPVEWNEENLSHLLYALAGEFPVRTVGIDIPEWMCFLPAENSAVAELLERVRAVCAGISKNKHLSALGELTAGTQYWSEVLKVEADFSSGTAKVVCRAKDGIFFDMLSEIAGDKIDGEYSLMRYVRSAAEAKRGYGKVRDALECARVNGYGIVSPAEEDLSYEPPQVVKNGSSVGIKLRASAPTYHVIRVDVSGEVSPIMGDSSQSESLVKNMMSGFENNPEETWNTDVFGKSLRTMVQEGLTAKVSSIQDETRSKLRKAITRMANEGKGGVICIIL